MDGTKLKEIVKIIQMESEEKLFAQWVSFPYLSRIRRRP